VRAKGILSTDIFGTLSRAGGLCEGVEKAPDDVAAAVGHDERDAADGETQRQDIPGKTWIRERAAEQRIPQLSGVVGGGLGGCQQREGRGHFGILEQVFEATALMFRRTTTGT